MLLLLLLALALVGDAARWPGRAVTWSTANEINVAGYIVERSHTADGPWSRASGLIVAGEDVFVAHDYRFVDAPSEGQEHWYRLTVVNLKNEIAALGMISP
jgi:hypothetical protein